MRSAPPLTPFQPFTVVFETHDEALRCAAALLAGTFTDDANVLAVNGYDPTKVKSEDAPRVLSDLLTAALNVGRLRRK